MPQHGRKPTPTAITCALAALSLAGVAVGCANDADTRSPRPTDQTAELLLQVTSVHEETGMTLLEGPTFDEDGHLLVVDVTAPPGEPKVMRVDVEALEAETVFTDEAGVYTSAQFSPLDGRLYLTDIMGGTIVSITPEGEDETVFFSGDVDGARMHPDDVAFDEAGNLYVSDTTGFMSPAWEEEGRVVRIDGRSGQATVLAEDLPAPNGISFDEDFAGLWVGQYAANRVDYYALNEDGTQVETSHAAIHFDGGKSRIDSIAVDAGGNLYQAVHGQPSIFVYSSTGRHLATVTVPEEAAEGLDTATNVAIAPGTTEAYVTVSGEDGGFVYTFDALDEGIRQSNGG
ncbi:SMP-30/gluconolactonase/LRE family protein [Nocardiopsis alkaliphila]|uniref:SMP-30/gluconolactonase/LRE family protein n=1 Tax=Nocardiopsis alkaliphila TaxID=225762 RepID=UPI0003478B4D|nr:SMP-30/gluconolactonase/LRE family protein [Nocardiopsis alkaliphila]